MSPDLHQCRLRVNSHVELARHAPRSDQRNHFPHQPQLDNTEQEIQRQRSRLQVKVNSVIASSHTTWDDPGDVVGEQTCEAMENIEQTYEIFSFTNYHRKMCVQSINRFI